MSSQETSSEDQSQDALEIINKELNQGSKSTRQTKATVAGILKSVTPPPPSTIGSKRSNEETNSPTSKRQATTNKTGGVPLKRASSIESIKKNPPSKVIKVCLEKVSGLLQQPQDVDYKQVKYWLVIADQLSKEINRRDDFSESISHIRTSYRSNKAVMDVLKEALPDIKTESS
eukprot:TRINITY_DN8745_c0_g1_i2.p1 TRINITY_DN8745_c0_g1~~TRINITY_DN8745_c0_g1_i2.p1  ORF type:complete len:196 (+),score=71.28 TRINITY_DN8745_c0_g1_i2:68-589(+)